MKYILDTNICIYALKNTYAPLAVQFKKMRPSDLCIPSIVKAELLLGAYKSQKRDETIQKVMLFLEPLSIVPFGDAEAGCYAEIRSALEKKGTPIGPNDYIIAATALSKKCILITHNTDEFSRVDGLEIQDWCKTGS